MNKHKLWIIPAIQILTFVAIIGCFVLCLGLFAVYKGIFLWILHHYGYRGINNYTDIFAAIAAMCSVAIYCYSMWDD